MVLLFQCCLPAAMRTCAQLQCNVPIAALLVRQAGSVLLAAGELFFTDWSELDTNLRMQTWDRKFAILTSYPQVGIAKQHWLMFARTYCQCHCSNRLSLMLS